MKNEKLGELDSIKNIFNDNKLSQKEINSTLVTLANLKKKGLNDTISVLNKFLREKLLDDVLINGITLKGKSGVDNFLKLYSKVRIQGKFNLNTSKLNDNNNYTIKKINGRIVIYYGDYFRKIILTEQKQNSKLGILDRTDNPFDDNELTIGETSANINYIKNIKNNEELKKIQFIITDIINQLNITIDKPEDNLSFYDFIRNLETSKYKGYSINLGITIYSFDRPEDMISYITKNKEKFIKRLKIKIEELDIEEKESKQEIAKLLWINIENIDKKLKEIESNQYTFYSKLFDHNRFYAIPNDGTGECTGYCDEQGLLSYSDQLYDLSEEYFDFEYVITIKGYKGEGIMIPGIIDNKGGNISYRLKTLLDIKKFDESFFNALVQNKNIEGTFEAKTYKQKENLLKNITIREYLKSLNGYEIGYKGIEIYVTDDKLNLHNTKNGQNTYFSIPEYTLDGISNTENLKYVEGKSKLKEMKKLIDKFLKRK